MTDWLQSVTNLTIASVGWQWLTIHIAVTAVMVGLIWMVQLVHYPSFAYIDRTKFIEFNRFHQRQITLIVAPAMLAEVATAIVLIFVTPFAWWIHALNLVSIAALWLSTALQAMPIHGKLLDENNASEWPSLCHKLVLVNWPRTIIWSARLAAWLVFIGMS